MSRCTVWSSRVVTARAVESTIVHGPPGEVERWSFAQEAAPAGQEAAPKAEKKEKKEKKAKKGEKRREEGGPEAVTFSFRQSRR